MINAMMIDATDDVAIAIEAITKGQKVCCSGLTAEVTALEDIAIYHKVAVRPMPAGHKVRKYGEHIGESLGAIAAGSHVHVHNVSGVREDLDQA